MAEDRLLLNIDQMAIDIGVPYEEDVSPDGIKRYKTEWTVAHMVKAVGLARPLADEGKPIDFCGGAPHWVLAAMTGAAYPRLEAYTILGLDLSAELIPLPMGEVNPEGGISFTKRVEDDNVYIDFESDDPSKPPLYGPHNYDRSLLPKVVVPEIEDSQHLFIRGIGEYSIIMTIIKAYCRKCKSINVAGVGADGYVCAVAYSDDRKIGDITPF